ncbi:MAG TPA: PGPGW domain-containing protein [Candidatus Tectomicrobia bacterium]|nr:PGPGW domain-containing protein [Candidatus Tectomicrobia bacterium]
MTEQKKREVKRWFKVGVGWCLLVVGVAGLFLPVIQGLLCIASGLTLLSTEYRWASVCLEWVKRKIRLRRAEKSAPHQPRTFAQLTAGRALGEDRPAKDP